MHGMGRCETLATNFLTITKRMPLKARVVLALSMMIVVFELVSGVIELGAENNVQYPNMDRLSDQVIQQDAAKSRERKQINEDEHKKINIESNKLLNFTRNNIEIEDMLTSENNDIKNNKQASIYLKKLRADILADSKKLHNNMVDLSNDDLEDLHKSKADVNATSTTTEQPEYIKFDER